MGAVGWRIWGWLSRGVGLGGIGVWRKVGWLEGILVSCDEIEGDQVAYHQVSQISFIEPFREWSSVSASRLSRHRRDD